MQWLRKLIPMRYDITPVVMPKTRHSCIEFSESDPETVSDVGIKGFSITEAHLVIFGPNSGPTMRELTRS
jgi:hypothetical protein